MKFFFPIFLFSCALTFEEPSKLFLNKNRFYKINNVHNLTDCSELTMKIAKDFNVYFQSQDPLHNEIFALDLTILNCETIPFGGLPNYFFHNFSNNLSIGRNYLPYWIASIEVKVDIKKNPQIDTFLVKEQLIYQVQGKDLRLIEAKDKKQAIDNGSLSPLFLTPSAFLRGQGEIDFLVHSSTFELTYDLFSKKILDQVLNKLENL